MTAESWAQYGPMLVAAAAAVAVAIAGALITDIGPWYRNLKKPRWQPPDWLFGPAWTLIFTLTAIAGVLAWTGAADDASRRALVAAFAVNGALNVLWSVLFFRMRRPDWALVELLGLWLSIAVLSGISMPINAWCGVLLLPYLAWVTFAGILNAAVVRLNKPFG